MRESLLQDVTYAIRMLLRTPGFSAVCVATMAIAIGANTAVFSVVYGVLMKGLPFPQEGELVVLGHYTAGAPTLSSTTPGNFYDWAARATAFERMAGFAYTQRVVNHGDVAEQVVGALSAGSLFDVLGRTATEGRTFTAAEDGPGAAPVVVLSASLRERLFGGAPAIGQAVNIGGVMFSVVGVMPRDFAFPDFDAQYWIPARFDTQFRQNRDQYFLLAIARLRDGVTPEQGLTQLDTVMDAIRRDYPQYTQNATAAVVPLKTFLVQNVETRLWMLLGAVTLVLVIACANISNLLLARGSSRRKEMALRHAIGARPQRLVRQMLTESIVLATLGGLAGVALATGLVRLLVRWTADDLPRNEAIGLDPTVYAVTATATLLCGVAFGLWPAAQLARGNNIDAMRQGARDTGRTDAVRTALVIAEVALAITVLVGAGLLTRSLGNLRSVQLGFEPAGLLTFAVAVPTTTYRTADQRHAYYERAIDALRTLPGVESVALSTTLPVAGRGTGAWFNMLDRPLPPHETPPGVPYRIITPDYFTTIGVALRKGRLLTVDDGVEGKRAVVISESVERRFWPGESALGKQIYMGAPDNRIFQDATIVGVVGDVKQAGLDEASSETVYIPQKMVRFANSFSVVIRTQVAPATLVSAARGALQRIDPMIPLYNVRTMDDVVSRSLAPARSSVYLLATFAVMALTLAVVGVFSVLSYTVSQRKTEMALRLALGASTKSVLLMVLQQGLRLVVIGIVVGLVTCLTLGRYVETLLFNVRPADPATLAAVALLMLSIGAIALYIPGRRATRVDPALVLKQS